MRSVFVTGATGFIGGHLLRKLARTGLGKVHGSYHESPPADHMPNVHWTNSGPLGPQTDWSRALEGVDVVVHAAARVHLPHRAKTMSRDIHCTNVDGTMRLARQACAAGVQRFIFLSTIAVYGLRSSTTLLTEETSTAPKSDYALSKLRAEQGLRAINGRMEVVIVRAPLVYGPQAPGNFRRLVRLVGTGVPLPFANAHNKRSMIGVDNLTHFLEHCLSSRVAASETFLVADDEDLSLMALVELIAEGLGRRSRLLPIPGELLTRLARAAGASAIIDKLYGPLQLDTHKARDLLKWQAPFPVRDGLQSAVRSFA